MWWDFPFRPDHHNYPGTTTQHTSEITSSEADHHNIGLHHSAAPWTPPLYGPTLLYEHALSISHPLPCGHSSPPCQWRGVDSRRGRHSIRGPGGRGRLAIPCKGFY